MSVGVFAEAAFSLITPPGDAALRNIALTQVAISPPRWGLPSARYLCERDSARKLTSYGLSPKMVNEIAGSSQRDEF
jgi:hypothetical protein